jgi:carbon monoxide dehydrogenase subunit G
MKLVHSVNKPLDKVFDVLSDMQLFCAVHPIIWKIVPKGNNSYLVYETLKIGFIPFSFTYLVELNAKPIEKIIGTKTTVFKSVDISM